MQKQQYFNKNYINSRFIASYYNKGGRDKNQDSITIQKVETSVGEILLASVCDGLGGMDKGEIASGYVIEQLISWFYSSFIELLERNQNKIFNNLLNIDNLIINSVNKILFKIHNDLKEYGNLNSLMIGTTCTIFLAISNKAYIFNVGDSALYRINSSMKMITKIKNIKSNVLSNCIGIGAFKSPEIKKLKVKYNMAFLLCSDGFYHNFDHPRLNRIYQLLKVKIVMNGDVARKRLNTIGKMNISKGETDNMSAIYIAY